MNIYYIDVNEFKKKYDRAFLSEYADKDFKCDKRFFEYAIGRYLIKNVAQKIYKLEDNEIITDINGKPKFKCSDLKFSLTHSKDYIMACFDESECGIDIEFMKERNFEKLSHYYQKKFVNSQDFYKFWTLKEASYKLGKDVKDYYSRIFCNKYYLTVVSEKIFDKNLEIICFN